MDNQKVNIITTKADSSAEYLLTNNLDKVNLIYYEDLANEPELRPFKGLMILRDPYNTGVNYEEILRKILKKYPEHIKYDRITLTKFPNYEDKLFQVKFFKKLKLKIPQTFYTKEISDIRNPEFPLLMKKRISSRNKGNFIVNNFNEIKEKLTQFKLEDFLFQEIIKFEKDLRCIVFKNEIIGTIERSSEIQGKKFKVKVKNEIFELPDNVKDDCIRLAKEIGADFLGIDLLKKGDDYFFIEANLSPQFKRFMEVTKINLPELLLS